MESEPTYYVWRTCQLQELEENILKYELGVGNLTCMETVLVLEEMLLPAQTEQMIRQTMSSKLIFKLKCLCHPDY